MIFFQGVLSFKNTYFEPRYVLVVPVSKEVRRNYLIIKAYFVVEHQPPLDRTTSTKLGTSTTFQYQTRDVFRALTPSCCLPVEKEAPGMRWHAADLKTCKLGLKRLTCNQI